MAQLSIFDMMYPKYKINKPIRLIELFSGYGSQALALKYLGMQFEHWKICEWAVKSIQAYKDLHFPNEFHPFGVLDISKEEIIEFLYNKGISSNYNEPMTFEQIKRLKEEDLYNIYENIYITNNLVNIQKVKGEDLEIKDTDKYCYIMTYSFPCQDLSLAGKGKGMSDTSTRSGMLWEVERILNECEIIGKLPQVLLMENVPQVHGLDNVKHFVKWQQRLEELGYKNYFQDLIATDYGIPQTRNRCFMISILGNYSYSFPPKIELKLKLKDLLEESVSKKYYLSEKQLEDIKKWNAYEKPLENMKKMEKTNISKTLTTRSGDYDSGMILVIDKVKTIGNYSPSGHNASRIVDKNYSAPTIMENHGTVTAISEDLKIRKLTPKECFRLMGVKDEDYKLIQKNQSDASLYHLAGDSIVVNVLMAIFKQLL